MFDVFAHPESWKLAVINLVVVTWMSRRKARAAVAGSSKMESVHVFL